MPSRRKKAARPSEQVDKYRFAQNVAGEGTVAERVYQDYALSAHDDPPRDPDVLLVVPVVKVDSIHVEVEDLDARIALHARVLDLVDLKVGVHVQLSRVQLDIKGVEAQALMRIRLDHVAAIIDRVLTTLDRNPELVRSLGRTAEEIGSGAGDVLAKTGQALEHIGSGAEQAVSRRQTQRLSGRRSSCAYRAAPRTAPRLLGGPLRSPCPAGARH